MKSRNKTMNELLLECQKLLEDAKTIPYGHKFLEACKWLSHFWSNYCRTDKYQSILLALQETYTVECSDTGNYILPTNKQATTIIDSLLEEKPIEFWNNILDVKKYGIKTADASDLQIKAAITALGGNLTTSFLTEEDLLEEKKHPNILKLIPRADSVFPTHINTIVGTKISMEELKEKLSAMDNHTLYVKTSPQIMCQVTVPNKDIATYCSTRYFFAFSMRGIDAKFFNLKNETYYPCNAIIPRSGAYCFSIKGCKYRMDKDNNLCSGFFGSYLQSKYYNAHARVIDTIFNKYENLVKPDAEDKILSGVGMCWNAVNDSTTTPFEVIIVDKFDKAQKYLIEKDKK